MFRQKQEINNLLQQILDAALLLLAFWGAHILRTSTTDWFNLETRIPPFSQHLWMVLIIVPFGPLFLSMQGFYQHPLQKNPARSLNQILRALLWLGLLVGVCVMFLRLELPSRAVLILFVIGGTLLLLGKDYIFRLRASHLASHGKLSEPVLLAGLPEDMERLVASFTPAQKLQIQVVGRFDISAQPLSALVDALHQHSVTRVIFAAAHGQLERVQAAIEACETEGVEAWLMADFIRTAIARPTFDMLGERPMLVFRTTSDASWELLAKRLLDIVGALAGLVLLSPVLLILALLIKLSSPGPVVFRQQRGGLHGRPFTMFKFRSMTADAELRKTELVSLNKMDGPVFKVDGDPRVTRLGHWLRTTSLDELPQLYNVLRGEMSLVGPRPLPLDEIARIESRAQRRRLSVPPGLTCLWQISGRNEITSFDEWVRLDLAYIDSWSLWLDIKILLRTVPVVVSGLGAR